MKGIKTNNKGFSLVELIIVIAIMAILVAVLAPQYMRYVDRSRYSRDVQMVDGVYTEVQAIVADPSFKAGTDYQAGVIKFTKDGADFSGIFPTAGSDRLETELLEGLGVEEFKSGTHIIESYTLTANKWNEIKDGDEIGDVTLAKKENAVTIVIKTNGTTVENIPTYDLGAWSAGTGSIATE